MINPYAQAFMIASRTEHLVSPRVFAARDVATRGRGLRLFRRVRSLDTDRL